MARSVSATLFLGFMGATAFYNMSKASALTTKAGLLEASLDVNGEAKVKITLRNKCSHDVRLVVGVSKVLDCKAGKVAELHPVRVKLEELNMLRVELLVHDNQGKKERALVDLGLLAKLVNGVAELELRVVEEVVDGVQHEAAITLLCGEVVLVNVIVKV